MLNENIRHLRKQKGLTQEELAIRLHVVRQTVSKWEKGTSVPDAALLQRLAEELDTEVSALLGKSMEAEPNPDAMAEQLARINEHLAVRNRRWRIFWTVLAAVAAGFLVLNVMLAAAGLISFREVKTESSVEEVQHIEE